MNKGLLNQLPDDDRPAASKLDSLVQGLHISPGFQSELEKKLMDTANRKSQSARRGNTRLLPALVGTALAIGAVLLLNWTSRSLATGSPGGAATPFDTGLPDNIGVGDAIQYDSDGVLGGNPTNIDAIAFIHGRISSTVYTVKNANGGPPTATTAKDNDWSINRSYATLFNWEGQFANNNIDGTVRGQVNPSLNLVTADSQLNVACYVGGGADTVAVIINGWTTGANNYINIFTPYLSSEVGLPQWHSGKWDATKYRLVASVIYDGVISIRDEYVL